MTPPRKILSVKTLPEEVLLAMKLRREVERHKARKRESEGV